MLPVKRHMVANGKELSSIGLEAINLQCTEPDEISHIIRRALVNGINVIDLCAGGRNVYAPIGTAIKNVRENVFLAAHFGAGFDELGEYEWIRDPAAIRQNFRQLMRDTGAEYIDLGLLHFINDLHDYHELERSGVIKYMRRLRSQGKLRLMGFSTHDPQLATELISTGIFDAVMIYAHGDPCDLTVLSARCASSNIPLFISGARIIDCRAIYLENVHSLADLDEILIQNDPAQKCAG